MRIMYLIVMSIFCLVANAEEKSKLIEDSGASLKGTARHLYQEVVINEFGEKNQVSNVVDRVLRMISSHSFKYESFSYKQKEVDVIYTESDKLSVVKALIREGIDLNTRNPKTKYTLLDLSIVMGYKSITWCLISDVNEAKHSTASLTSAYNLAKDRVSNNSYSEADSIMSNNGLIANRLGKLLKKRGHDRVASKTSATENEK